MTLLEETIKALLKHDKKSAQANIETHYNALGKPSYIVSYVDQGGASCICVCSSRADAERHLIEANKITS